MFSFFLTETLATIHTASALPVKCGMAVTPHLTPHTDLPPLPQLLSPHGLQGFGVSPCEAVGTNPSLMGAVQLPFLIQPGMKNTEPFM